MFKAILIRKDDQGYRAALESLDDNALPVIESGGVTVRVSHSTLNYKDGLAITGRSPVVRQFPMVPGIDLAGTVEASEHPDWAPGDAVVLNGWGVGETHWGGLAQRARLKGDWLVPLPEAFTPAQAMAIGTAGYTAMLCVMALQRHWAEAGVKPGSGEVLVTGANGGVGSIAIALLAGLGHTVVASTGRLGEADFLKSLGAAEVIDRSTLGAAGKPLQKERWIGVVDSVGSHTLANACASTRYGGAVAACGLAQGMDLPASVAPFILRGVTLFGIDSVMAPMPRREAAWAALAQHLHRQQGGTRMQRVHAPRALQAELARNLREQAFALGRGFTVQIGQHARGAQSHVGQVRPAEQFAQCGGGHGDLMAHGVGRVGEAMHRTGRQHQQHRRLRLEIPAVDGAVQLALLEPLELVQALVPVRGNRPVHLRAAHRHGLVVQAIVRLLVSDFAKRNQQQG